jgi:hypothetical protein
MIPIPHHENGWICEDGLVPRVEEGKRGFGDAGGGRTVLR